MSSDSSEDENLGRLREAVDSEFFNDSLFKEKSGNSVIEHVHPNKQEHPVSLRRTQDEDEQFNLFRVTPEFRNYVAKHLSIALEAKLQKLLKSVKETNITPSKRHQKSGIRLFKNSNKFLKANKNSSEKNLNLAKSLPVTKISQQIDEELIKQVAIEPEDILNKKDTKYWSNRSKAQLFHYKKSSEGNLVLVEPPFN